MSFPPDDSTTVLLRAIARRFPGLGFSIVELISRSWASITFTGARHELHFRVEGDAAEAAAEAFVRGLEAVEFELHGHILADIALVSDRRAAASAEIRIEALTVEDR